MKQSYESLKNKKKKSFLTDLDTLDKGPHWNEWYLPVIRFLLEPELSFELTLKNWDDVLT